MSPTSLSFSSFNTTTKTNAASPSERIMDGGMHGVMTPSASVNGTAAHKHKMVMHMSFFWGTNSEILFHGWPGSDPCMYALALIFIFFLSLLVEWLTYSNLGRAGSGSAVRTLMHVVRVGLGYMVMLAVMSFNVGVFLVAVMGHGVGFLLFGSRVFGGEGNEKTDFPPMSC